MKKNTKTMMTIWGQDSAQGLGSHLPLPSLRTQSQFPKYSKESQRLGRLDSFPGFYLRGHNLYFHKRIRSYYKLSSSENCAKTIKLKPILEHAKRIIIATLVKQVQRTHY